ncbi:Fur family transcriptional regulator [Sporomusa acidovorans]|uniref:Transcriptional regulator PerR n=1 Tax=Sporomusa acidovorans (strain ATCC 49682 / DSM 3132 / Mol) TaxID=1123286 RepID=A0ABZ3J9F8_SPOA4|nr:Fur family transcriptional regulator [Sporomusa acidovorans]OZC22938.1 transcriptional regulator PerR [Sporomusa acidovorans DSM 3132]SDE94673.1 Fur family transcriptional regulator, peroxide stress response regulator [Sporomusa acidovorans]
MDICVTSLLRDKGFKVTPQRLAIYNALVATKAHPSAEMIYNELQPVYPTMSLATVYKTIEILKTLKLVQVLNVGEDSFRYDADTTNHPHIRCMCCGRVDDLHGVDSTEFTDQVAATTKYTIQGQQFYFYGVCPKCQAAASAAS